MKLGSVDDWNKSGGKAKAIQRNIVTSTVNADYFKPTILS